MKLLVLFMLLMAGSVFGQPAGLQRTTLTTNLIANGGVGQYLRGGGAGGGAPSWDTPAGAGTVTHTGALGLGLPVFGNGGSDIAVGTKTGNGTVGVMQDSPSLITPALGAATVTTLNGLTLTTSAGGIITLSAGKTFTVTGTLTLTGTDGSSIAFGAGGTVVYQTRSVATGAGLSGGGDLSADRTLLWAPETRVDAVILFDGSQTSRTITYNLAAGDPVLTLDNGVFNLTSGFIQQGGVNVVLQNRLLTVSGTPNQITSSAGAQDLSADRTWALSFPTTLVAPGSFTSTGAITNLTAAAGQFVSTVTGGGYTNTLNGFTLTNLNGTNLVGTLTNNTTGTATGTFTSLSNSLVSAIGITVDGGGSAITAGIKGYISIPYACTILNVTMLADQTGSAVIDIWKDTYANYPPTIADTITASAKPTISAANKSQDTTLTGWTTSVAAGDILAFSVDATPATIQRLTLILKVLK